MKHAPSFVEQVPKMHDSEQQGWCCPGRRLRRCGPEGRPRSLPEVFVWALAYAPESRLQLQHLAVEPKSPHGSSVAAVDCMPSQPTSDPPIEPVSQVPIVSEV